MSTPAPILAYYGDDFTGSTDALEFLSRAGIPTVLFTNPPTPAQLARYAGARAVGVAGTSRSLGPAEMELELRPAFAALRALGPRHVHYKVCSTFDSSPSVGSIGRAAEIGREIFGGRFVPLLVGAPALGRYCVFANLFAQAGIGGGGGIHRLDRHPVMSRHPVTPADESDLRRHLARQTRLGVGLFDILMLGRSAGVQRTELERLLAAGAEVVLFDVLEQRQLESIGRLIDAESGAAAPLFSVGSSAIEMALGACWTSEGRAVPRDNWPVIAPAGPLLVVSGSCSPVTEAQIRWSVGSGFAEIALDPARPSAAASAVIRAAVLQIRAGRNVIVHTQPAGNGLPDAAARPRAGAGAVEVSELGATLGRIAREVVAEAGVKRLVVAGGDTSSYAARALGIEAIEMIAPLAPGAPLCRSEAPGSPADGIEVNFKGGQVGAPDYFGSVASGRLRT